MPAPQDLAVKAPWWLVGGHLQTIWPSLSTRYATPSALAAVHYRRERWSTPDADFIDLDWQEAAPPTVPGGKRHVSQGLLVLFHGLEGSSHSHYALAFAHQAKRLGLDFVVPHFRGCSGELNHAPRAYHSGDFEEIGWVLQRLREHTNRPLLVVGVSLGGNALLRWAQEAGGQAQRVAGAIASVSAPLDLVASGQAMGRGFNRHVYTRIFLNTMKPKALAKLRQYPGLFDADQLRAARSLYEFDNVFTAPLHGFNDTADYWQRASAKPHLDQVALPCLVVNAENDPFVPASSLPRKGQPKASKSADPAASPVTLWQPAQGGHVGFASGRWPGQIDGMPTAVIQWLLRHLPPPSTEKLGG
jgi:predicted alpha/beta-fold hydrolase